VEVKVSHQDIFELSPQWIFIKDKDNNFVRVNQACARGLGMKKEDLEGKSCFELHPKDLAQHYHEDDLEVICSNEPKKDILEQAAFPDGSRRWVRTSKYPYYDEEGEIIGIIGFATDITNQVVVEQKQITIDKIYEAFMSYGNSEVFKRILDLVLEAFESRFGVFGYVDEKGDLIVPSFTGDVWYMCQMEQKPLVWPPNSWQGCWGKMLKEKSGTIINDPNQFKVPNGHVPITNWMGVPILHNKELVGVFQVANCKKSYTHEDMVLLQAIADRIAPLVKAYVKIDNIRSVVDEKEEKLTIVQKAVEQTTTTVLVTDVEGTITYVNPRFSEVTGYHYREVLGENPRILKSEKVKYETYVDLWQTIKEGKVWRGEFINKTKDGKLYWELASISPVVDEEGRITHYVKVAEVLSELKSTIFNMWSMLDYANYYVVVLDAEMRMVLCNALLAQVLGYDDPMELIGAHWLDFIDKPTQSIIKSVHKQILSVKSTPTEFTNDIVSRSGKHIMVRWFNSRINGDTDWTFSLGLPLQGESSDESVESVRRRYKEILSIHKQWIEEIKDENGKQKKKSKE
jgi:PAS domain S-box-containing protein